MRTFATALALVLTLGTVSGLAQESERTVLCDSGLGTLSERQFYTEQDTDDANTVFAPVTEIYKRTMVLSDNAIVMLSGVQVLWDHEWSVNMEPIDTIVLQEGSTLVVHGNLPSVDTLIITDASHLTVNGDLSAVTTLVVSEDSSLTVNGVLEDFNPDPKTLHVVSGVVISSYHR